MNSFCWKILMREDNICICSMKCPNAATIWLFVFRLSNELVYFLVAKKNESIKEPTALTLLNKTRIRHNLRAFHVSHVHLEVWVPFFKCWMKTIASHVFSENRNVHLSSLKMCLEVKLQQEQQQRSQQSPYWQWFLCDLFSIDLHHSLQYVKVSNAIKLNVQKHNFV